MNGQQFAETSDAAVMIQVPVRDDQMIDRLEPDRVRRLGDTVGVTRAGVAAVDEHRFAGGRDDQRRGAAFRVDEVNVEPAVRLASENRQSSKSERKNRQT